MLFLLALRLQQETQFWSIALALRVHCRIRMFDRMISQSTLCKGGGPLWPRTGPPVTPVKPGDQKSPLAHQETSMRLRRAISSTMRWENTQARQNSINRVGIYFFNVPIFLNNIFEDGHLQICLSHPQTYLHFHRLGITRSISAVSLFGLNLLQAGFSNLPPPSLCVTRLSKSENLSCEIKHSEN